MIVDSLIVEIGLDPSKLSKGAQQALNDMRHFEEEAARRAGNVEESSKKIGGALGDVKTQALELFAIFTGGKGLIEFAAHTVTTNSQLGRLSRNLDISAATLSKWQGAARIFGGDGAAMAATFTTINDAVKGFEIGAISPLIAEFRNLSSAGGTVIDINKGVDQTLLDISANLAKVNAQNPGRAGLLGRRLGLDPGLYDLLVKGPAATQAMLDKVNALGPATKEATDAAGDLEKRWNGIAVKADAFGRKILESGAPTKVGALADELNKPFFEARPLDALFGWGKYAPQAAGAAPPPVSAPSGAFASANAKEAFIRTEAVKRGLDPDVMVKVAKSEGFDNFLGDNGTSGGAFQLHVTPGGRGNAVGDQFARATGKSPLDPANEALTIQYALDDIRAHGLTPYHGAARVGLGPMAGGAGQGAPNTTTTTSIAVNGPITINAGPNADGTAIANAFREAVKRQSYAAQANNGQN